MVHQTSLPETEVIEISENKRIMMQVSSEFTLGSTILENQGYRDWFLEENGFWPKNV
jgi:hypothetical protein